MAMQRCDDCGRPISSRADECPQCGRTMFVGRMHEIIGVQGILIVLALYFAFTHLDFG